MAYTLKDAKQVCTKAEYDFVQLAHSDKLAAVTPAKLRQKITRARKLRDKYRDESARQRREARGKAQPRGTRAAQGNIRTVLKAEIFTDVLGRVTAALADQKTATDQKSRTSKGTASRPASTRKKAASKPTGKPTKKAASKTSSSGSSTKTAKKTAKKAAKKATKKSGTSGKLAKATATKSGTTKSETTKSGTTKSGTAKKSKKVSKKTAKAITRKVSKKSTAATTAKKITKKSGTKLSATSTSQPKGKKPSRSASQRPSGLADGMGSGKTTPRRVTRGQAAAKGPSGDTNPSFAIKDRFEDANAARRRGHVSQRTRVGQARRDR